MKKLVLLVLAVLMTVGLAAEPFTGKVLYVYDETNDSSTPFVTDFRNAFASEGIPFDEALASDLKKKDLSSYSVIVIHSMVMAFNSKSPVRTWLQTSPNLAGKKVSLLVTANRWYLKDLFGQLTELLKKDNAQVIDAVSMATKTMSPSDKTKAVNDQVSRLK